MILPTATFITLFTSILAVITSASPAAAVGYDIHSLVARVDTLTAKVDEQSSKIEEQSTKIDEQSNKIPFLLKQKTDPPQVLGNKKLRGLEVSPTSWTYDKDTINGSFEDLQAYLNAIANCVTYDDSDPANPVCKVGSPTVDVFVPGSLTADGDITASGTVAANTIDVTQDITAGGDIISTDGNIVAISGNIEAQSGNVTADMEITAGGDITSTDGNIVAQSGNNCVTYDDSDPANPVCKVGSPTVDVLVPGSLTTNGDITASGNVAANTIDATQDITAGGDIISTDGNIVATSGNIEAQSGSVTAGMEITAGGDITSTGDIRALQPDPFSTGGNIVADGGVSAGGLPPQAGVVIAGALSASLGIECNEGVFTGDFSKGGVTIGSDGTISASKSVLAKNVLVGEVNFEDEPATIGNVVATGNVLVGDAAIDATQDITGDIVSVGTIFASNVLVRDFSFGEFTKEDVPETNGNIVATGGVVEAAAVIATFGIACTEEGLKGVEITANGDIFARGEFFDQVSILGSTGSVEALGDITGGSITANGDIRANGSVIADMVTADLGVTAGGDITSTGGDIVAQMGSVTADMEVTAGGDITSTGRNIVAQSGNVTAAMEVFTDIIDPDTGKLTVEGDLALNP